MADQLVFNDSLNLIGLVGTGVVTLSGPVTVDYGTNTATGTLNLTAAGLLGAQTYTNLVLTQNAQTGVNTLTGSNTLTSVSITYTGQTPTTMNASVSVLPGVTGPLGIVAGLQVASGTGNVTSTAICFAHGTNILTDRGEVAIENLKVGDLVVTPYAETPTMEIRWIGRQSFAGEGAKISQPVLIHEGALGQGLPHRDLRVSSDHCLYLDGRLVPAKLLVNGVTIIAEHGHANMEYVNIELDKHTVVLAEGVESESYLDCGNRARFDNGSEPCAWLDSRPARDDSAWNDGSAFAEPLWGGPRLAELFARFAGSDMSVELDRAA